MKKLIPFIAFLVLSVVVFAQSGVNFEHLTFDEALAKAKAEKKLVFVDCYTTWCGPCKYMTKTIFPQEKAGEFFNPRFVSIKFDMEQGEGKELKEKLKVKAYPSFFIIRPDGSVQHGIVGSGELEPFIESVKTGLNEKTSLLYLKQKYEKGKMGKRDMMAYKQALNATYDQEEEVKIGKELSALLTDKDKMKAEYWPLFEDESCIVGSADFNLLLANLPVFEKNLGKEKLDAYLYKSYSRGLAPFLRPLSPYPSQWVKTDPAFLVEVGQQIATLNIAKKEYLLIRHALAKAAAGADVEGVVSILEKAGPTLPEDEFYSIMRAFEVVREKATKADFSRMAAIGEQMMAKTEDEESKEQLALFFDPFKKAAHVGVYFEDLTLEKALAKAKRLRKLVFMDGYTSWCGPCKYMANTIFPMEKVGDFMNAKFVCVKYDMEKGEGPELMKRFGIRAFPTFVIIKPDGSVQHKVVGGGEADQFIERLKEGSDETKATGLLDAKYQAGNRDKEFLQLYIKSLVAQYSEDATKVANELLQSLSDEEKVLEPYWFIFESNKLCPKDSEGAKYLLANREKFNATIGKEKVDKRLSSELKSKLTAILGGRNTKTTSKDLDQMKKDVVAMKLNNEKVLLGDINIAKAIIAGNVAQLLTVCEKEIRQRPVEEFMYVAIVSGIKGKSTPAQMDRWIKMGESLIAKSQSESYKEQLVKFLERLKSKA